MKVKNNYWTILQYQKRHYCALGWEFHIRIEEQKQYNRIYGKRNSKGALELKSKQRPTNEKVIL